MCCVQATVGVAAGTAALTTDLDIYRTAKLLIRDHDAMLDADDMGGKAVWPRVLGAVREMQDREPAGTAH
jgi:hypothetical protein